MSRKRSLVVTTLSVSILCVLFLFLSMTQPKPQLTNLSLRVVREETQRQAVFFRIEGADGEPIYISSAVIVSANHGFGEEDKRIDVGRILDSSGFISHALPLRNSTMSRREFGVTAPANCQVWNFLVTVKVKESLLERLHSTWSSFKGTWDAGANVATAFQFAWGDPHEGYTTLKSEMVTNRNSSSAASN